MKQDTASCKKASGRQSGVQSIRRTIDIIRSVSRFNDTGARLATVAKDVDLPAPTVHRILSVLQEEDFLTFDRSTKRYNLGPTLYTLATATKPFSLRDRYHTCLQRLSNITEDASFLVVRSGYDSLCIDRILGSFKVQVHGYEIGERRVFGVGASGTALLAFLPESLREEIITANSERYINQFGIYPEEIRDAVALTIKQGYFISVRRVTSDSVGVGVPVFNRAGRVVAAISVSGINNRMGMERSEQIARLILEEIKKINPPPD